MQDGGNGIIKQLKKAEIPIDSIRYIFISHTHMDHILGVLWLIRKMAKKYFLENCKEHMYIYGNDEVINAIIQMCNILLPDDFKYVINDKIKLIEVKDGDKVKALDNEITFFDINASKVKQFGFYMWVNPNKKFTFIGDEVCSRQTEKFVKDSFWLFADAYLSGKEAEKYNPIKKHHHSTVKFVAELSNKLNVRNLIMSHTMDNDLENRREKFSKDAQKYYNGGIFVPEDLEIIEL